MPDQFGGDPAPNSSDVNAATESSQTIIEQVKLKAAEAVQSFMIDMWLARQTPEKVVPLLQKVIEGAREEFADSVANGEGVYAVGYCFGGKYVFLLGSEIPDTVAQSEKLGDGESGTVKKQPMIKAGALAHGTMVTLEDIENVKVPISMVCVESDQLFPDEVRTEGQKKLEEQKVEHEVELYSGMPHGTLSMSTVTRSRSLTRFTYRLCSGG